MKTLCYYTSKTAPSGSLKLNEEEIHVRNCIGKENVGVFFITITKATAIKFSFPSYVTIERCNLVSFEYVAQETLSKGSYHQLTALTSYYFKISPDAAHASAGFEGTITFDDITALSVFNANGNGFYNFKGLSIDVNDLIKFSLVSKLYLSAGLNGIGRNTILDLTDFENITHLYLGQNDEDDCLYGIELTDRQMEQIIEYNVHTQFVPPNIWHLKNARTITMHGFPSWRDVLPLSDKEKWREKTDPMSLEIEATYGDKFIIKQFIDFLKKPNSYSVNANIHYLSEINFHR
ncbi:MAG: hypothetical protein IJ786_03775 [Bacteroidaceae bacterium]|nr:hypothetical protein [Bacteroidaceae bacterium]